jgi:hypothetical protein
MLIYFVILIWIIYKKGFSEPYIYVYLMPIFLYEVKHMLENYNPDPGFYSLYLFFGSFYFWLFKTEINKSTKFVFYLLLFFNSFYLIYSIYPSLYFII